MADLQYGVVLYCSTVCTCVTQYCALRRHNSLKWMARC